MARPRLSKQGLVLDQRLSLCYKCFRSCSLCSALKKVLKFC